MKATGPGQGKGGFIVVLLAAGLLITLVAVAGLAIDVGHGYLVKSELENAADAAALAGAGQLYQFSTTPPTLSWATAETAATNFIGKNNADGAALIDCTVESGYWNASLPSSQSLAAKEIVPGNCSISHAACVNNAGCTASEVCMQTNAPAVKVTVTKSSGNNGGPVATFFARIVGTEQFTVHASAVAVTGFVGAIPPGVAFPFAMTTCVVNDYFSRDPLPAPPIEITDTSPYHLRNGTVLPSPGQWTNLQVGAEPSSRQITDFIDNLIDPSTGTPAPPSKTGDQIALYPGTRAAIYHETQDLIDAGKRLVYLPVVDCDLVPGTVVTIRGYVGFELTSTTNSSMTGHLVSYANMPPGTSPAGGGANTLSLPRLVK